MPDKVDARGLSCPQPVLLAVSKMKQVQSGEIEVLVDNEVSLENVTRAAKSQGWELTEVVTDSSDYHLYLKR
jgi:tRNA 2-thiouridine synthesizing protein A